MTAWQWEHDQRDNDVRDDDGASTAQLVDGIIQDIGDQASLVLAGAQTDAVTLAKLREREAALVESVDGLFRALGMRARVRR